MKTFDTSSNAALSIEENHSTTTANNDVFVTVEAEHTISSVDIIEDANIEFEEIPLAANDNEPIIPDDPDGLALFIENNKATKAEIDAQLSPTAYKQKEDLSKENAEDWLKAQLKLGQYLHSFPTKQGYKPSKVAELEAQGIIFRDVIVKEYGLTHTKLRYILDLDQECVNDTIAESQKTGDLATRSRALELKKQRVRKANKAEFNFTPVYSTTPPNEKTLAEIKREGINYTVLLANIGIGETFLEELGFYGKVAFELEKDRCEFYSFRYPNTNVVNGDLFDKEKFDEAVRLHKENGCELVLASPVCRPFSKMGSNNLDKIEAKLFYPVIEFIKATQPKWIIIENVPGFLASVIPNMKDIVKDVEILAELAKHATIGDYIEKTLTSLGYEINISADQNTADYGTPQSRERAIILASKTGLWEFPQKNEFRASLVESIGHLPSLEIGGNSEIKHHNMLNLSYPSEVIEALKTIGSWQSQKVRYTNTKGEEKTITVSRKNAGLVCGTITGDSCGLGAHNANAHYGRPKSDGTYTDARPLSIRELLIVLGLDPDMDIPQKFIDDDKNLRAILGEAFAPHHVMKLCQMLPYKK